MAKVTHTDIKPKSIERASEDCGWLFGGTVMKVVRGGSLVD
jgi:hypothetical protein